MKKTSSFFILSRFLFAFMITGLFNACQKQNEVSMDLAEEAPPEVKDYGSYKLHTFLIDGAKTNVKEQENSFYLSDCEILSKAQLNILKSLHAQKSTTARAAVTRDFIKLWPEGRVYYTLTNIATQTRRDSILKGMDDMEAKTGVRFFARTNQPNYIRFQDHAQNNNSPLGMSGGEQVINLARNNVATAQHEIMHSLGFRHEQCRPDRDSYVIYYEDNVQPDKVHNFDLDNNYAGLRSFDFNSIMLYSSYSWSANSQPVLTRLNGTTWPSTELAAGSRMSAGDVQGVKFLYQSVDMKATLSTTTPVILVSAVNNGSALALQNGSTNANTPAVLWALNNSTNQNWRFVSAGNGEYYIASNINTERVLGTQNGSLAVGTNVVLKTKSTTARDQRWKIYYAGTNSGYIKIVPADATSRAIEINGGNSANGTSVKIQTADASYPNRQKFRSLYH